MLNATIDKYIHSTLASTGTKTVVIRAVDYEIQREYELRHLKYDGELDLAKGTINSFGPVEGFELTVRGDMPPGSGMGTSSSLVTAMIGCLTQYVGKIMTKLEVARLAYHIEREELGFKGGYQDQFAASYGGMNFMEFRKNDVIVTPLCLEPEVLNEMQNRSVLLFTRKTRSSSRIHERMRTEYRESRNAYVQRMDDLKETAYKMRESLTHKDLDMFGHLLHRGWR